MAVCFMASPRLDVQLTEMGAGLLDLDLEGARLVRRERLAPLLAGLHLEMVVVAVEVDILVLVGREREGYGVTLVGCQLVRLHRVAGDLHVIRDRLDGRAGRTAGGEGEQAEQRRRERERTNLVHEPDLLAGCEWTEPAVSRLETIRQQVRSGDLSRGERPE